MDTRPRDRAGNVATARQTRTVVRRSSAAQADTYSQAVGGLVLEAVRAGPGTGTSEVMTAFDDRFTLTTCKIGFPMLSRTTVPDDKVVVACLRSTGDGSRWCDQVLEPNSVLIESSGCRHTARNQPGLEFTFAITDWETLHQTANNLGVGLSRLPAGRAALLAPNEANAALRRDLATYSDLAGAGTITSPVPGDDVLGSMVHVLRSLGPSERGARPAQVDSRQVVHACIDYARSIGRLPSISELCLAAHVSERRLRIAFSDEFDMPPSQFFRCWALGEAHRLLRCCVGEQTVTDVAMQLGFGHLGRFAGHYRELYGEAPSATLRLA